MIRRGGGLQQLFPVSASGDLDHEWLFQVATSAPVGGLVSGAPATATARPASSASEDMTAMRVTFWRSAARTRIGAIATAEARRARMIVEMM
jgi:hypothetical protein